MRDKLPIKSPSEGTAVITKEHCLTMFLSLSLAVTVSCKKDSDDDDAVITPGSADGTQAEYADEKKWLCLPGRDDTCSTEPATNELLTDGSFAAVAPNPTPDESVDCFYVHPTSDLSVEAGNSKNFEYLEPVEELAKMQAAPFHGSCRIFAPLYRQMTIGSYVLPEEGRKDFKDIAFRDVLNAFDYYMANFNQGRKFVLIGHSQGSEMLSLVMKERIDPVPALRSKLILAILPGFAVHTPIAKAVGGTFANIPACTTAGEVGCVIAFRSFKSGTTYLGDGTISLLTLEEELCVNPATLDDPALSVDDRRKNRVTLGGTLLPPPSQLSDAIRSVSSPTPFVLTKGAYSAACDSGPDPRNRFLSIEEALPDSDLRHGIVLLDAEPLNGVTGLHRLDMQFPMAELVKLVRARR
jgi:hypothetical protein